MDRFVAMIWDHTDPRCPSQIECWSRTLLDQSQLWTTVLDAPGLRVFSLIQRSGGPVVTIWKDADGVAVGPMFHRGRETDGRVAHLPPLEARRAVMSRGASLVKDYWGNYVAFWRNTNGSSAHVLRDPCGAVPCFMTRAFGVDLLFAHVADVASLPGLCFTINWTYVKAFMVFNYFVTKHTGLTEITELLAGETLECCASGERHLAWLWNGAEFAAKPTLQSYDDAKAELRETASSCFKAWGREYRTILVQLSGGLDSSILVNLLRSVSDASITAMHFVCPGYEQFELQQARLAAASADVRLVEIVLDPHLDSLRQIVEIPRLARPSRQVLGVLADTSAARLGEELGASCFAAGHGGDNLFLHRSIANHTLADYIHLRGYGPWFWRIAYDASTLKQQPISRILRSAVSTRVNAPDWQPFAFLRDEAWTRYSPLDPETLDATPHSYKMHPWLTQTDLLPPGKADHLSSIVALNHYYTLRGSGLTRDSINPFFAQPLAEYALRTPTYVFCKGGIDRALERDAFADLIPQEIVRRTNKGGVDRYLLEVTQENLTFLRDFILNGSLLSEPWINRHKAERLLTRESIAHGGGAIYIHNIAATEAWLQSWRTPNARAAA